MTWFKLYVLSVYWRLLYVKKFVTWRLLTPEYKRVFLFKCIMVLNLLKIKNDSWLLNKLYITNYNDTYSVNNFECYFHVGNYIF